MDGRGNSFANGPGNPRTWENGWQAPEPVSVYRLDGELYA
jgi:hypothetical protein